MPDFRGSRSPGPVSAKAPRCASLWFTLTAAFVVTAIVGPSQGSGQSSPPVEAGVGSAVGGAVLGALTGALAGVSLVTLKANVLDSYAEGSVREALGELLPWVIGGAAIGAISISTGEGATIGHAVGPTVQGAVAGVATGAAVGALTAVLTSLGPENLGDELPGGVGSGALIGLGAGALVGAIEVWTGPGEEHNGWGPGAWGGGIAAIPLFYWSVRF